MPFHVVDLVRAGLNRNQKSISGCKIIVIGVAYKKNVNDVRESPALDVMRLLVNDGAELSFHDPFVPNIKLNGSQLDGLSHLTEPILNEADAVVIMTDHDQIDFDFIEQHGNLIIDTRNSIKKSSASVIKLGVGN
jgi:UDP-N-acetyl-D-mannosaminuronate dehydrogenase